jgi:hypothetical protein
MNRREFFKLVIGTAAFTAAPAMLFARPDVRGWRFGVWELQYRYGENFWARCDCGTEQEVSLERLLSVDGLSCDHVRHRGFFSIRPEALICQNCDEHRRFFFNGDGFRIWRCGNCEEADIRAYLRREYGPATSVQFTANMKTAEERNSMTEHCKRDDGSRQSRNEKSCLPYSPESFPLSPPNSPNSFMPRNSASTIRQPKTMLKATQAA